MERNFPFKQPVNTFLPHFAPFREKCIFLSCVRKSNSTFRAVAGDTGGISVCLCPTHGRTETDRYPLSPWPPATARKATATTLVATRELRRGAASLSGLPPPLKLEVVFRPVCKTVVRFEYAWLEFGITVARDSPALDARCYMFDARCSNASMLQCLMLDR